MIQAYGRGAPNRRSIKIKPDYRRRPPIRTGRMLSGPSKSGAPNTRSIIIRGLHYSRAPNRRPGISQGLPFRGVS